MYLFVICILCDRGFVEVSVDFKNDICVDDCILLEFYFCTSKRDHRWCSVTLSLSSHFSDQTSNPSLISRGKAEFTVQNLDQLYALIYSALPTTGPNITNKVLGMA